MATTFDEYVAGEARASFSSLLRPQEEFDFLLGLYRPFGCLNEVTKVADDGQKDIRFLQVFVHDPVAGIGISLGRHMVKSSRDTRLGRSGA